MPCSTLYSFILLLKGGVKMFHVLAAAFDSSVMTEVVSLVTTSVGVLTEFPCNMFLYGGLAAIGFKLFAKAKKAVK